MTSLMWTGTNIQWHLDIDSISKQLLFVTDPHSRGTKHFGETALKSGVLMDKNAGPTCVPWDAVKHTAPEYSKQNHNHDPVRASLFLFFPELYKYRSKITARQILLQTPQLEGV